MSSGSLAYRAASTRSQTPSVGSLHLMEGRCPSVASDPSAQMMPAIAHANLEARGAGTRHSRALGLVACALLFVLVACTGFIYSSRESAYAQAVAEVETCEIEVASGDSLWSLAERYGVDGLDTSQTVDLLIEWNGLESATLQPGMFLVVPDVG